MLNRPAWAKRRYILVYKNPPTTYLTERLLYRVSIPPLLPQINLLLYNKLIQVKRFPFWEIPEKPKRFHPPACLRTCFKTLGFINHAFLISAQQIIACFLSTIPPQLPEVIACLEDKLYLSSRLHLLYPFARSPARRITAKHTRYHQEKRKALLLRINNKNPGHRPGFVHNHTKPRLVRRGVN